MCPKRIEVPDKTGGQYGRGTETLQTPRRSEPCRRVFFVNGGARPLREELGGAERMREKPPTDGYKLWIRDFHRKPLHEAPETGVSKGI